MENYYLILCEQTLLNLNYHLAIKMCFTLLKE